MDWQIESAIKEVLISHAFSEIAFSSPLLSMVSCIFNSIKPIVSWFLQQYVFMSMYFLCFTQESMQVNLHVHYCVTNSTLCLWPVTESVSLRLLTPTLQDLHLPLAYLQRLPGVWSVAGWAGKTRSIGSPFMERGRFRAFLKDPLLKELGNCSALAWTS